MAQLENKNALTENNEVSSAAKEYNKISDANTKSLDEKLASLTLDDGAYKDRPEAERPISKEFKLKFYTTKWEKTPTWTTNNFKENLFGLNPKKVEDFCISKWLRMDNNKNFQEDLYDWAVKNNRADLIQNAFKDHGNTREWITAWGKDILAQVDVKSEATRNAFCDDKLWIRTFYLISEAQKVEVPKVPEKQERVDYNMTPEGRFGVSNGYWYGGDAKIGEVLRVFKTASAQAPAQDTDYYVVQFDANMDHIQDKATDSYGNIEKTKNFIGQKYLIKKWDFNQYNVVKGWTIDIAALQAHSEQLDSKSSKYETLLAVQNKIVPKADIAKN